MIGLKECDYHLLPDVINVPQTNQCNVCGHKGNELDQKKHPIVEISLPTP